jgi:hypothetical protein
MQAIHPTAVAPTAAQMHEPQLTLPVHNVQLSSA